MAENEPNPAPTPAPSPAPAPNLSDNAPTPAPAPAPKPAGTIADDPGPDPAPGPATWPADWRKLGAGGDEALAKELERHPDIPSLVKSWKEQKALISKGAAKADLPADAKPEQVAEWRKANGIPEKHSDYKIELGGGLVIGEEDKPMVDKFLERMHGKNARPEIVNEALATYFEMREQEEVQMAEAIKVNRSETIEALRNEWGPEFKANVNSGKVLLEQTFGEEAATQILTALGPDKIPLGDNINFLKGMAKLAREINPAASLMPAGGATPSGVEAAIAEIETVMKTDRPRYNGDEKMQQRLRDLYAARERMRSAA